MTPKRECVATLHAATDIPGLGLPAASVARSLRPRGLKDTPARVFTAGVDSTVTPVVGGQPEDYSPQARLSAKTGLQ